MKKLTFTLFLFLSSYMYSQMDNTYIETKVAIANETKDTLYVLKNISALFIDTWNKPYNIKEKPTIIVVESLIGILPTKNKIINE